MNADITSELFYGEDEISPEDGERIFEIEDTIFELELLLVLATEQGLTEQIEEIEEHILDLEDAKAELEGMYV